MKKIGIVGGGQLGLMLAEAAKKLGFYTIVLDPAELCPASKVANEVIVGGFKDKEKIRELAQKSDVITFEIESACSETLLSLQKEGKEIHPSPSVLQIIKDKYAQKKFLEERGVPVAESLEVSSLEDLQAVSQKFGLPILLKSRFDAYDGRGNFLVTEESQLEEALLKLGGPPKSGEASKNLYAEKFVPFIKEIAVVASRGFDGEIKVFPIVETVHKNNICHEVICPAEISDDIKERADKIAEKVMEALQGVGVFGIEMFVTKEGEVVLNEVAPRVHNSGHHTIEACQTSQFEQHIRAVTGLTLGETNMIVPSAVMINILGDREGEARLEGEEILKELEDVFLHIYGKMETRKERKMGHITVVGDDQEEVLKKARKMREKISI